MRLLLESALRLDVQLGRPGKLSASIVDVRSAIWRWTDILNYPSLRRGTVTRGRIVEGGRGGIGSFAQNGGVGQLRTFSSDFPTLGLAKFGLAE